MQRLQLTHLNNWIKNDHRKPLIIRGARQVGKSTLVRDFAAQTGKTLLDLNLEKHPRLDSVFKTLDLETILENISAIFKCEIDPAKHLLFLDEIQATPHALPALRYFYEEQKQLPVIAAGSLLEFLLSDHLFSMPVGRIEYLHMFAMTFTEFLLAMGDEWLVTKISTFEFGQEWPEATHQSLSKRYREYLIVGGMPEAVLSYSQKKHSLRYKEIQDSLVQTYRDDFAKYATTKEELGCLQQVYATLPGFLGKKTIFSNVSKEMRAAKVRSAIEMLESARIVGRVFHTNARGLPLASQMNINVFKTYWLDSGLLNRTLGLVSDIHQIQTEKFFHEGLLAEQFVFQHLHLFQSPQSKPEYFYWLREGKAQNSEVDFVIPFQGTIVPIEVKSSKSGSLKSLHQFVREHGSKLAVKLCSEPPSLKTVSHTVLEKSKSVKVEFDLMSIPLYFIEALPRLLI